MKFSRRRFPDRIIRRREGAYTKHFGEPVPGPSTDTEFWASVQPEKLDYILEQGGHRLSDRWVCIVPVADALRPAFTDRARDEVIFSGEIYGVVESKNWAGHTEAILFRQI